MQLIYDICRAHKLVPVQQKDWGLQAFRLPKGKAAGFIFLHTKGTFGIASAAHWWQRVAAFRLGHRLVAHDLGLMHLLFAVDGWMVANGVHFWRKLLFWLFLLELNEFPVSWRKVRGGVQVRWIGYGLDVEDFTKGISPKKVAWVKEWWRRHKSAGRIFGRDLKSALGRLTFVAGALQHVRPLLGPVFVWSAVLSPGCFAKFPDAAIVLMEFLVRQISEESMSLAFLPTSTSVEISRVDAKAEEELIVLGGWESFGRVAPNMARWFSLRLSRKSAPWAYMKGDPYRCIASLELVAVLVALVVFSRGAAWRQATGRLSITASTDGQVNMHVMHLLQVSAFNHLDRSGMSDKRFATRAGFGLDTALWNQEADDLTNEEFGKSDESRRLHVVFEEIRFKVMSDILTLAAELDQEIALAKTSKEAKGISNGRIEKRKRGETKWKDPW
jgi:hypothetical protein